MGENIIPSAQTAYTSLVAGVEALDFSHVIPCILQLTADKAFPLLANSAGEVLIAASQYGRGKIVVLPNEECLTTPTFFPFLQNAVNWLKPSTVSQVGVQSMFPSLAEFFTSKGHKVQLQTSFSNTFEVYCKNADEDSQSVELISFIKGGGGLLIAGMARSWASNNSKTNVFSSYPGNKVAGVAGIHFTERRSKTGVFSFSQHIPAASLMAMNEIYLVGHMKSLLNGISEFNLKTSDMPSQLFVHGGNAFSLSQTKDLRTPLAAALYGRGRIVVMTQQEQLCFPSLKPYILNALSWLDAGRNGEVGVERSLIQFHNYLHQLDIKSKMTDLIPSLSVFSCNSSNDRDIEKTLQFVAEGGGLLVAGQAWFWSYLNRGKEPIVDYAGNKLLNRVGISMLGVFMKPDSYKALNPNENSLSYHFCKCLWQLQQYIIKNEDWSETFISWIPKMNEDMITFLKIPFEDSLPCLGVHELLLQLFRKGGISEPSREKPIKKNSKEASLLYLRSLLYDKYAALEGCKPAGVESFPVNQGSLIENILVDGKNKGRESELFTVNKLYIYCK
ncbi:hypothetical protein FKM82_023806 [Ascaphus truei]